MPSGRPATSIGSSCRGFGLPAAAGEPDIAEQLEAGHVLDGHIDKVLAELEAGITSS